MESHARRLLGIHSRTHCCLHPPLMNCRPPSNDIIGRILRFYYSGINLNDSFIDFIFKNSFYSMSSIMCQNIFSIISKLSMNALSIFTNDFQLSSAINGEQILSRNFLYVETALLYQI